MENRYPTIDDSMDYVKRFISMDQEEQQEKLRLLMDYLKEHELEEEFFMAAANILDSSIIEDVKRWYNTKNKL